MNFRTTAILFILLIAVGVVVLFTQQSGTPTTETTDSATKLLSIAPADVTKVAIVSDDGQHIDLQKADSKWNLSAPVTGPAEDAAVASLLETITGLETRGKIAADASSGLDQPRYKLDLTTKDGKTTHLDVGGRSGAGDHLYVRLNSASQADVVQAALVDQLAKPIKQWRRERLTDASPMEVKQLKIATTQQSYTLEKQGENWAMTTPSAMPIDPAAVSDLTMAITSMRVGEFASETTDDAKYGLDKPVATVSFSTAAPTTQPSTSQPSFTTLKFGHFDDLLKRNVFVSSSAAPGVVAVSSAILGSFNKTPLELRDHKVLTIDPEKVTKISLATDKPATTQPTTREASHEQTTLERAKVVMGSSTTAPATSQASTEPSEPPSKWKVALGSAAQIDADDAKVNQLLADVNPLRTDKYMDKPSAAAPVATYKLTIDTTDATHEISISDPGNGQPLVASYQGLTFTLPAAFLEKIQGEFTKTLSKPIPFVQ